MPIKVHCPNPKCKKSLEAPDDRVGQKARCPGCGHIITVPDPAFALTEVGDPLIGSTLGNLKIMEKLGAGGMGTVYLATNTSLDRLVAVKILSEELVTDGSQFLERFLREARTAAKLIHPNAVVVHSVGEEEGRHFIEMEFVQGMNLRQVMQRQKRLDLKEASRIITDAARALSAAHKRDIVHRDIKPGNIMLTEDGQVKVADFGVAKVNTSDSNITRPGQVVGTPFYMPPEQARAKPIDCRADIYSLGATYYPALVGRPPFNAETPVEVALKHIREPVSWPDDAGDVPPEIRSIIEKMLAKSPDDRHATCEEVIEAIEDYFKPKAVVAKAVQVATPVQHAIPIAPPPKTAYAISAGELEAIESAARGIRRGTGTKKSPAKSDGAKPSLSVPKWILPTVLAAALVVAGVTIAALTIAAWRDTGDAKPADGAPSDTPASSCDEGYVATAATGDTIPHPLSKRTCKVRHGGRVIEVPEGMVFVPAGPFLMGRNENNRNTGFIQREVYLGAYFIDKYEVTNAQYLEFVRATWRTIPKHWQDNGGKIPEGRENHPVVNVTWEDAQAYAKWCGKRLPTEAEWEKAAAWDMEKKRARAYPWGDRPDPKKANNCHLWGCWCEGDWDEHWYLWGKWVQTPEGKKTLSLGGNTTAVGAFRGDVSPFGCFDMAGNVREWVSDWYREDYYKLGPNRNPRGPSKEDAPPVPSRSNQRCRVLRGNYWQSGPENLLAATRDCTSPRDATIDIGFRCAADYPWRPAGADSKTQEKQKPGGKN